MIKNTQKPSHLSIYFRGHKRALLDGFFMPWKNPVKSLMTIFTLMICFVIPLFLWTLWLNYDELKLSWQSQGTIAVFVTESVDLKEAGILLQEIKENQSVENATLSNSFEIIKQLKKDQQLSQIVELITAYDLPKQINIKIKESTNVNEIVAFVGEMEINPQIEYVSYDEQWLSQLNALTHVLLQLARISAFLFVLIIMVILANAIGNEITDHKSELRLLELMGATWAQVRRSFLYMGTFYGIYAGVLAVLFLSLSFLWLDSTLNDLMQNFGLEVSLHGLNAIQIIWVVFVSILVTWLAARLTLSSQRLNQVQD